MATRRQTKVYVLAQPAPDSGAPTVTIDRLKEGQITFGVKVSARTAEKARVLAEAQFEALRAYADTMTDSDTERKLRASTELMNKLKLEARAEVKMPPGDAPCPCGGNHLAFGHYSTVKESPAATGNGGADAAHIRLLPSSAATKD